MGAVLALVCALAAATLAVVAAVRDRWHIVITGTGCTMLAAYAAARLYIGVAVTLR
jgi:hypothetical protein